MGLALVVGCQGRVLVPETPESGTPDLPPPVAEPPPVTTPTPDYPEVPTRTSEFVCADPGARGPAVTPRRTRDEMARVLTDLTGLDLSALVAELIPQDLRADGFTNQAGGQVLTVDHVAAFETLGTRLVERLDLGAFFSRLSGSCEGQSACRQAFIQGLGHRLLGRAPSSEAASLYLGLFDLARTEGLSESDGAALVLQAMLQSPDFLYPLDRPDGEGNVDGLGLARRLAALVWLAGPDDTLIAAARSGALETNAQVEAQVRRMLTDPRARTAAQRFVSDWLHLDRLDHLDVDTERYPTWTPGLGSDMRQETLRFFEHLAFDEGRPVGALFDAQLTFASPALAELYGLSEAEDPSQPRALDSVPERGGLLTQASLLTVGGNRASLVERGLFVLETLLCGEVLSPPVDVVMMMGEVMPGVTQRTYSEQRLASSTCGSCHIQMDPLAFALERFDGVGGYATQDRYGNPVRTDGALTLPDDDGPSRYDDVAALSALLGRHPRVRACMVLKTTQYALGRRLVPEDGCALVETRDHFEASGQTWTDLLVAVATSPLLRAAGADIGAP